MSKKKVQSKQKTPTRKKAKSKQKAPTKKKVQSKQKAPTNQPVAASMALIGNFIPLLNPASSQN
jgi:hypothetical protein